MRYLILEFRLVLAHGARAFRSKVIHSREGNLISVAEYLLDILLQINLCLGELEAG